MLFLIKQLIRHLLFFALLSISIETVSALYSKYQLEPATFFSAFFTYFCNSFNTIIQRLLLLEFQDFVLVEWALWLLSFKPYYIILGLVLLVVYFNLRQRNLQQPQIIKHPKLSVDRYEQQKRENTKRQLKKLKQSPEYFKYKMNKFYSNLPEKSDDKVVAELRQKETQFF